MNVSSGIIPVTFKGSSGPCHIPGEMSSRCLIICHTCHVPYVPTCHTCHTCHMSCLYLSRVMRVTKAHIWRHVVQRSRHLLLDVEQSIDHLQVYQVWQVRQVRLVWQLGQTCRSVDKYARYASVQVCKYASMQVCKRASMASR